MTKRIDISNGWSTELITQCVSALARGEVIITPTDTIYGFAARAVSPDAVKSVQTIKGSNDNKAFIVLACDEAMIERFGARLEDSQRKIIRAIGTIAVTFVLGMKPASKLGHIARNETVAVRFASHKFLQALIAALNEPILSTSVNRSGEPPILDPKNIPEEILSHVTLVIDEGPARSVKPSTIIDVTGNEIKILREGAVPIEKIEELLKKI